MLSFFRKRIGLAGLSVVVLLLSGCASFPNEQERETKGGVECAEDAGERISDAENGTEEAAEAGGYYYRALSEEGEGAPHTQALYMQMLVCMQQMGQEETLLCGDEDLLYRIFCCVLADHPELFYVTGYTYTKAAGGGENDHMKFSPSYSMSKEDAARAQSGIDEYVAECFLNLPDGDDYERIRYFYEYIICHTEYDLEAPENQNICSVFLYGRSVCQGYAKAFQYLCAKAGIEVSLVTGRIRESGYGHAWNFVNSNGAYYYVDTTWGDVSYTMDGGNVPGGPEVNYEYLCVTTEQITRTHEIDLSVVKMPECTATEDNYFVREQAFFHSFDENALDVLFARHEGEYVTFRCETADVYSLFYEYLIGKEHIFDYMDSDAGVSYSDNEETLTFSFWLPQ